MREFSATDPNAKGKETMTGRQVVCDAIAFNSPERMPVWMFNRDQDDGDILMYSLGIWNPDGSSEWGYKLENLGDGTAGQPGDPVIPTWDATYHFPELNRKQRLVAAAEFNERAKNHYRLGVLGITGFNVYTFLRGFEDAVMDIMMESPEGLAFLDKLFAFEKEMITVAGEAGLDGFHFADDWGTQDNLMISPELWRKVFKPRYKDQFDHAHKMGLHVWFHCCGCITSIIPDFHEIGVDVMNISQPNSVDIEKIGALLRGKQCFLMPISYQTVSISGTPEEICEEASRLHHLLGTPRGGFIGYVEEYSCMGMTEENYQACIQAFQALR